jgi:hypothetical protein
MKEINISQSLIKGMIALKQGKECGLVFQAKFVHGIWSPPSEVQKVGLWFEYMVTGAVGKDGITPVAEYTTTNELKAPYKRMQAHIANFKRIIDYYKIIFVSIGTKIITNGLEGTVDIVATCERDIVTANGRVIVRAGELFFIDIKTTGLIEDKWNDYGWAFETLKTKTSLILQPIHYKYLSILEYGYEVPFLFFIFSQTNEIDHKLFEFRMVEDDEVQKEDKKQLFDNHKELIENTRGWLIHYDNNGYEALPEVSRCAKCMLKDTCKFKIEVPPIDTFNLKPF